MEPSGARTRSSGSGKFSASTITCGLRFNGVTVSVGFGVDGSGVGVKVSVTGKVGERNVGELSSTGVGVTESGAGVVISHAKDTMRHKIAIKSIFLVDLMNGFYQ